MRSILPFLFLSACSDYDMVVQKDEVPAAVPVTETVGEEPEVDTATDDVPTDDTAVVPVEEDTAEPDNDQPVETDECNGFVINEGFGHYEETQTYAIFSLVGDSEIEVRQGETATFMFAVTAHKCGDIVFTGFMVVQSVIDYIPADWVTNVEHSGETSTVANLSGSAQFAPIDGYNCNADGSDSQIFYEWRSDVTNAATQGAMDAVDIKSAATEIFAFSFTATEYVGPGTKFDLYLYDPMWNDVGTGAKVWDTYYYLPSYDINVVKVRVTIVE